MAKPLNYEVQGKNGFSGDWKPLLHLTAESDKAAVDVGVSYIRSHRTPCNGFEYRIRCEDGRVI
jgi:hypothetical protein